MKYKLILNFESAYSLFKYICIYFFNTQYFFVLCIFMKKNN